MTKAERLAAVFGIAFAIIYAPTMDLNWTLARFAGGRYPITVCGPTIGTSVQSGEQSRRKNSTSLSGQM
jgi:hypothetical protein